MNGQPAGRPDTWTDGFCDGGSSPRGCGRHSWARNRPSSRQPGISKDAISPQPVPTPESRMEDNTLWLPTEEGLRSGRQRQAQDHTGKEAGSLGAKTDPSYLHAAPRPCSPVLGSGPTAEHRVRTGAGDHAWSPAGSSTATAHPCPAQASHSWQDKGRLGQSGSGVSLVGVWPLQDVSSGDWQWGSATTGGCKSD